MRSLQKSRTPLTLGWEAARANAWPALILQALMLALLIAFYGSSSVATGLWQLAEFKQRHGTPFVVVAAMLAGAVVPELFLILFFQRARPTRRNLRTLLFTIPVWGFDGWLVDLLYRGEAALLGDVASVPVVLAKICIDQFGYNVLFAAPFGVLTYEWKNSGISMRPVRDLVAWQHYREKILPTLVATWAVWIPLMAIIYSLPLALQFPLFSLALSFWVLLLTYMTNRFAGKIETDAPLALATTKL
ncbi:MAG TPA: Mpv17/PMP22 family protein [Chthoniobacterales bacterium]